MNLKELKTEIRLAAEDYYSGNPSISDDEFDALLEELKEASPQDELLQTIAYGYNPVKDTSGAKIKHKYQTVGSLNKINAETCEKYFAQRPGQYCITSKIDGGSVVVYYDSHGRFDKAITRGDGTVGIDCSSKLKLIVPSTVTLANIAVRGEIIMSKTFFELNYPDAASPRNTALGIIGKDNPTPEEISRLSFVAYNVYGTSNSIFATRKSDIMKWLYENGFTTATYTKLFDRSPLFLEGMKGKLNPEFPADGLVITNELDRFDEIAYKFVAETAETTVTDVTWETSRLGSVIPVVHFNPVKLSGARLAKCSGFNAKWICDNRIGPFSKIVIHRSGEVIPYIKEVLKMGSHSIPTNCPDCNTKIEWKGVHVYCPNGTCPKKIQLSILHWIEKMAPVDSLGENILIPFLNNFGWKSIGEIYDSIDQNDDPEEDWNRVIVEGCRFSNHASDLLWDMYKKLYNEPADPDKFFAAFGLPAVGETISKKISDEVGIHEYFKDVIFPWGFVDKLSRKTEPAVRSLYENYGMMKMVYEQIKNRQGFQERSAMKKIKIAITGKLSKGRKELAEEFAAHGVEVVGSITKDCKYLVTDDPTSGSSKNLMAQKLGIEILSESDFREIMI